MFYLELSTGEGGISSLQTLPVDPVDGHAEEGAPVGAPAVRRGSHSALGRQQADEVLLGLGVCQLDVPGEGPPRGDLRTPVNCGSGSVVRTLEAPHSEYGSRQENTG